MPIAACLPSNIATTFSACPLYELRIFGRVSPPITHHFVIVNHWKRFGFIGVVLRRFLRHTNYAFTTQFMAKCFSFQSVVKPMQCSICIILLLPSLCLCVQNKFYLTSFTMIVRFLNPLTRPMPARSASASFLTIFVCVRSILFDWV